MAVGENSTGKRKVSWEVKGAYWEAGTTCITDCLDKTRQRGFGYVTSSNRFLELVCFLDNDCLPPWKILLLSFYAMWKWKVLTQKKFFKHLNQMEKKKLSNIKCCHCSYGCLKKWKFRNITYLIIFKMEEKYWAWTLSNKNQRVIIV